MYQQKKNISMYDNHLFLIAKHVKEHYVAKGYGFDNDYVDRNIVKLYCLYVSEKENTKAIEAAWDQEDKEFRAVLTKVRTCGGTFEQFANFFRYDII
tara:strand:+ start:284 stop:574 length:291 start_codon:yes stop_codon:yes gene_type:complete